MNISYFKDTDTLYISFNDKSGSDAKEIIPGVVIDFDEQGIPVGIEFDGAGKNFSLPSNISSIPFLIRQAEQHKNTSSKNKTAPDSE